MKILAFPAILLALTCVIMADSAAAQTATPGAYCQTTYTYNSNSSDYINGVKFLTTDNQNSGYTAVSNPSPYKNYTYFNNITGPVVVPSQAFTVAVTNTPSYPQGQAVFVDWNRDDDFTDPGEAYLGTTIQGSGATGTFNLTVPANAVGGLTRLRAICVYNALVTVPCGNESFGEVEDYDLTISASPTISTGSPPSGKADLPWSHQLSVTGGIGPYTWTITDRNGNGAKNGAWVNIDPATGYLFGTPPASVGNDTTTVRVSVADKNNEGENTLVSWFVGDVPSLPYFDAFETDSIGTDYSVTTGAQSQVLQNTFVKAGGTKSLLFTGVSTSTPWPIDAISAAEQMRICDDSANWIGDTPDMKDYVARWEFTGRAADTKKVKVELDMRMFSGSTSNVYYKNAAFEWSEDFGLTWNPIVFANSNANGVIRYSAGTFNHEVFDIALSGKQDYFSFRVTSLMKWTYTGGLPCYLSIDNFSVDIPLQQTLPATLPAAQETAPYDLLLTSAGGQLPHSNWQVTNNSLPLGVSLVKIGSDYKLFAAAFDIPGNAAGTYSFELSVTDGNNVTEAVTYNMTVKETPPPLAIVNNPKIGSAGENSQYRYTLSANGGLTPYTFELKSSNVNWLSIDPITGALFGNAPANTAGLEVNVTIKVSDLIGSTFEGDFRFDIVNQLTVTTPDLPDASESSTYRKRIVVLGGTPPYNFSLLDGGLPSGLGLNALTGEFFGAPLRGAAGNYSFDMVISDSGSQLTVETITLSINPASSNILTITTPNTLPAGFEEVDFSVPFDATGGTPPYIWSAQPGTLPPGLSLTSDGRIVGTPNAGAAKAYTVMLSITDALSVSTTKSFTIDVQADPTFPEITATQNLPKARVGVFYTSQIQVQDGTAPYVWTLSDPNALPSGLAATPVGDSLIISGLPLVGTVGIYAFELTVTDANLLQDSKVFTVSVEEITSAPLEIVAIQETAGGTAKMPNGRVGESFGYNLLAVGGAAPYSWMLANSNTPIPAGMTLNAFGSFSGTPVANTAGDYIFEVQVRDAAGRTANRFFSLKVLTEDDTNETSQAQDAAQGAFQRDSMSGSCALGESKGSLYLLLLLVPIAALLRRRREA